MFFKPSKAKKAIIYKENDFGFILEIKTLIFHYPKYQLGFFWISRIRCDFKCELHKLKISFLRHMVNKDGVETDPDKIKAVAEWSQPENVK